ncbi:endonuclease III [Synergistaceae bacterium OttesenSCG-928-D05]|nr:endonuclease III [Synergistaceae bacterium OttesenSCG-928-D05]
MQPKKPARYKEILDALESVWGNEARPSPELGHEEPLDGLILTVLSQHTNDRNRDKAFANLKRLYPTWAQVNDASVEVISDAIRTAGLGNMKAEKIKKILPLLKEKFGDYSIKDLANWELCDAYEYLVGLPGVGVKTAACVLVFDLGMPAFPVDTHVARIAKRLGWAPEKMSAEKIQEYLESTLPPERFRGAHLNMIEHGRGICDARKPKCGECPAKKWCAYGKKIQA